MAAYTSSGTGDWSNTATWGGSGPPVAGDTVTISNTHVVTADDTSRACAAITLNGTLKASRTANCKLAYSGTITINSTGYIDWGTEASPIPSTYTATLAPASGVAIQFNASSYGGKMTMRGDSGRTAWTTLASNAAAASSAPVVTDATGWAVGDELLFVPASSTNNNANHIEIITLSGSYTPGSTTLALSSALTYAHIAGGRVCNLTRNCVLEPSSGASGPINFRFDGAVNTALSTYFRWARFKNVGNNATSGGFSFANGQVNITTLANFDSSRIIEDVDSCVFYRTTTNSVPHIYGVGNRQKLYIYDSVFIDTTTGGDGALFADPRNVEFDGCTFAAGDAVNDIYSSGQETLTASNCWFAGKGQSCYAFPNGISGLGLALTNCIFSGAWGALFQGSTGGVVTDSGSDWGYTYGLYCHYKVINNTTAPGGYTDITSIGGKFNATYADNFAVKGYTINKAGSKVRLWNKNASTSTQEYYTPQCRFSREASTVKNSPSSLKAEITTTDNLAQSYTFQILAKNGETLLIKGFLQKNASYGSSTRPTVTVSGLGITPVTYTMTDVTATWEEFDLPFSQSSGTDGLLDVTFTVQSSSSSAVAYLSGVSISPFVTRSRHYGYLFNETSPTCTVDPLASASFATADAYTGMAITWGASSSTAITDNNTFQKLFDHHQAKATQNVGSAVALTGAGTAGSPSLFAAGNVTISTGKVLNGSGSLSMGSYTLSTEFASGTDYTYTGGTWAQALTTPSFSGGTLNIGAAGVYVFDTSGTIVINMTPTGVSPPNYDLDSITANGVVDLRNTTAHAITVELSSAVAALAITSNNTGGTITVTAPIVTADISITGMPDTVGANTRLQIINQTAAAAADWQPATVYAAGDVRLRTSGVGSEQTAGLYMRCTAGGTSGGTEPTWDTTVGNTTADNTVTWTTYSVLYYHADPAATSFADTYIDGEEFLAGETIEIRFAEEDPAVSFKTYSTSVIATAAGFSALVSASADSVYATYGLSGAAQDSVFSPNYVASYIVLDANINFAGSSAYAYYCYLLTTDDGMYRFWGGLTGIDPGNIRNNVSVISLYFDETAGFVRQTDDVRIFRSDGARPALDPTTGGSGIEINWKVPVNVVTTGGSALTTTEHNALMGLPSAAVIANEVVNVVTFP